MNDKTTVETRARGWENKGWTREIATWLATFETGEPYERNSAEPAEKIIERVAQALGELPYARAAAAVLHARAPLGSTRCIATPDASAIAGACAIAEALGLDGPPALAEPGHAMNEALGAFAASGTTTAVICGTHDADVHGLVCVQADANAQSGQPKERNIVRVAGKVIGPGVGWSGAGHALVGWSVAETIDVIGAMRPAQRRQRARDTLAGLALLAGDKARQPWTLIGEIGAALARRAQHTDQGIRIARACGAPQGVTGWQWQRAVSTAFAALCAQGAGQCLARAMTTMDDEAQTENARQLAARTRSTRNHTASAIEALDESATEPLRYCASDTSAPMRRLIAQVLRDRSAAPVAVLARHEENGPMAGSLRVPDWLDEGAEILMAAGAQGTADNFETADAQRLRTTMIDRGTTPPIAIELEGKGLSPERLEKISDELEHLGPWSVQWPEPRIAVRVARVERVRTRTAAGGATHARALISAGDSSVVIDAPYASARTLRHLGATTQGANRVRIIGTLRRGPAGRTGIVLERIGRVR